MVWTVRVGRTTLIGLLLGLVAFVGVVAPPAQARAGCSDVTLRGQYLRTASGTVTGVGPIASIGVFTADGNGSLEGKLTTVRNGVASQETFTGTYNVNADCTGSETIFTSEGRTVINETVIDGHGDEYFALTTNVPVITVMVHAQRQFPAHR